MSAHNQYESKPEIMIYFYYDTIYLYILYYQICIQVPFQQQGIFNVTLNRSKWVVAKVNSLFRKGNRLDLNNYRHTQNCIQHKYQMNNKLAKAKRRFYRTQETVLL